MKFSFSSEAFCEWLVFNLRRFRISITVFFLLTLAVSVYYAGKLTLVTDLARLLPEGTESVDDFRRLQKNMGGIGFFTLILESEEPAHDRLVRQAGALVEKIQSDEFIQNNTIDILFDLKHVFFRKYGLLYADLADIKKLHERLQRKIEYEKRRVNPLLFDIEAEKPVRFYTHDIIRKYHAEGIGSDYLMNAEQTRLLILLKPSKPSLDLAFSEKYYNRLSTITAGFLEGSDTGYMIGGRYIEELEQNRIITRDIARTSGLTLTILILTMVLFFRSVRAIVVVGLPLLTGLVYTFALTYFFIGRINLISAFLASILLGLGIDYGIHLFSRFKEERVAGHGLTAALVITFQHSGSSVLLGALTTASAFIALSFSEFSAFSEFGLMALIGVLVSVAAFFLYMPVMVFFTERFSITPTPMLKAAPGRRKIIWLLFAVGIGLNIFTFTVSDRLPFEYNFARLAAVSKLQKQADEHERAIIDKQKNPMVYEVDSLDMLRQLEKNLQNRPPTGRGEARSLLLFEPDNLQIKQKYIAQMHRMLLQAERYTSRSQNPAVYEKIQKGLQYTDIGRFSFDQVPAPFKRIFQSETESGRSYYYFLHPAEDYNPKRGAIDFARLNRFVCIGHPEVLERENCPREARLIKGTASAVILSDVLRLISRDVESGLVIVVSVILFILLLVIRSFRGFLLVVVPLAAGITAVGGVMYLLNEMFDSVLFRFNYINVIAFPILLGVGIDNGLHLVRRLRESGLENVNFTMSETGNAVFLSNLTTVAGFASLIFAAHKGLASLGMLTFLGIGSIYIAYASIFPLLARLLRKIQEKRDLLK